MHHDGAMRAASVTTPLVAIEAAWVPLPAGGPRIDVEDLATAHFEWLAKTLPGISVKWSDDGALVVRGLWLPAVRLSAPTLSRTPERSQLSYENLDSLLYRRHGLFRLTVEHREGGDQMEIALLNAVPRYPRVLYQWTQLPLHNFLTRRFARRFVRQHLTLAAPAPTKALSAPPATTEEK